MMNKPTAVLVLLTMLSIVISGCSIEMESLTSTPSDSDSVPVETLTTPTVDICAPLDIPDIAFPRQEPVEGFREVMEAELVGNLVLGEGCLRIDSLYGNESYLPVWPPEFVGTLENDVPVVLDGDGTVVGRVGEEITMSGGEATASALPACVRQQMPPTCSGKYWIVGDGVRLNLKFDSELFTMDLVPASDRTAILLKKEPVLDEWVGEPDAITGVLRFFEPGRCPRIMSESGTVDLLPIWPQGYSIQVVDAMVEILDIDGNVVVRQDESVTLNGALLPLNWENPNYRQLHEETPGDCFGPYWIVTP